ncbi:MAG: TatD family hydrolase, partial [Clostridia bacterium]
KNMFFAAGVHPEFAQAETDFETWLLPAINHKKCVAIGEIGLDYFYDQPSKEHQKSAFYRQLDLALKKNMPVVIHDREAHADCVAAILARKGLKGVFHSFSGSAETAKILQNVGFYISFSGVISFKNAAKSKEACLAVSDERLLVETDCPYLAPTPFRGKRNDTNFIKYTIQAIADVRGTSFDYIEKITTQNAENLFGLSQKRGY